MWQKTAFPNPWTLISRYPLVHHFQVRARVAWVICNAVMSLITLRCLFGDEDGYRQAHAWVMVKIPRAISRTGTLEILAQQLFHF
jgi:hypothetical protein